MGGLAELIYLDLSETKVKELNGLSSLTKLQKIYLHNNKITDIDELKELKELNELTLAGNDINNYTAVEGIYYSLENKDFQLNDEENEVSNESNEGSTNNTLVYVLLGIVVLQTCITLFIVFFNKKNKRGING